MILNQFKKMEIPFRAMCINDADRPGDIPTTQWLKVNRLYTVVEMKKLLMQGGKIGFKLAEVNLKGCAPYEFYLSDRFAIVFDQEIIAELELNQLLEEAKEEENEKFIREKNPGTGV